MNLYAAQRLTIDLMRQHGLLDSGWTFGFDHARRRFGCCWATLRRITLSRHLVFLNGEAEVRETILHEIAHALVPGDGHGAKWKAMCRRIGARPVRCFQPHELNLPPRPPAAYQIGCLRCDVWTDRRRPPREGTRYLCRHCRTEAVVRQTPPTRKRTGSLRVV